MKLWILLKPSPAGPAYEELRFREEARVLGIALELVSPDEIDLIVTRGGRRTSYFSLAILRQFEHLGVPVINSSRAIEAVKDKLYSQQLLAQINLPI
ncbi:MAG: RimK family alpha-L-glutamate ligase, partial [Cyanobium sp.]